MSLQENLPFLGSICEGCLSVDRKLTATIDEDSLKIYRGFLGVLEILSQPLLLCWECTAILKRILHFSRRVRAAHNYLVKFMLHQTSNLSPLSDLSKHNLCSIINVKYELKTCELTREKEAEPLTFVKIEDQDDPGQDDGNFYMEDGVDKDVESTTDEKSSKAVIKSDPFEYEVPIAKNKTKRKGRRKTKMNNFDESDDEPLKPKKDAGVIKAKKKKQIEEGPKIDRRKHPAPKREKPAGVVNNPRVTKKLSQLNVDNGLLEMVVLSWEEVEAERQRSLVNEVFTRHEYRCYDCVVGFNHKFKLVNHMKKHDPSVGGAVCSVCRIRCRDTHALCAHRRRHRVRWRCVACGAAWSRAGVAADHAARAHGASTPTHTCSLCGHTAATLGKLRSHVKSHSERQKCEVCGKTFRDRTSLRTHLFIHNGEKEYECPRCGKKFLFKKAMQTHLITHESSAQLYCHECDMNFKNRMSYNQHIKYNLKHIDPAKLKYACQLCDKKFVKATRLEEHNLAVHLKATPIQCMVAGCNFACASRPVLRTHVRMLHRNARARRDHVCHVCGKTYTTKKSLEGHLRAHTGERPFHCTQCPAAFGYEAALYNHNRLVHLKKHKTIRGRNAVGTVEDAEATETAVVPVGSSDSEPVAKTHQNALNVPPTWNQISLSVPSSVLHIKSTTDITT